MRYEARSYFHQTILNYLPNICLYLLCCFHTIHAYNVHIMTVNHVLLQIYFSVFKSELFLVNVSTFSFMIILSHLFKLKNASHISVGYSPLVLLHSVATARYRHRRLIVIWAAVLTVDVAQRFIFIIFSNFGAFNVILSLVFITVITQVHLCL